MVRSPCRVDRLPEGLSAIVVTADLQGRECASGAPDLPVRLLGECLPRILINDVLPTLGLEDPNRVATFLAGDFYAVPALDKRGGRGDVTSVWHAFVDCFAWVAGVAGNHDLFGERAETRPQCRPSMHYLDGDVVDMAGLRVGGIGGIIGKPSRPQRREETNYIRTLESVLSQRIDVLLMHEGASGTTADQRGNPRILAALEQQPPKLVICGHNHWPHPLARFRSGLQILNVDGRVVLLTA